jgi:hypothetical protein
MSFRAQHHWRGSGPLPILCAAGSLVCYPREARRASIRLSMSRSRAVACFSRRSPSGPPCSLARSLTPSSRERCRSSWAISSSILLRPLVMGSSYLGTPCSPYQILHIHPAPQDMDRHTMSHEVVKGPEAPDRAGAMQDPGYGPPRIHLPRTPVNRGPRRRTLLDHSWPPSRAASTTWRMASTTSLGRSHWM